MRIRISFCDLGIENLKACLQLAVLLGREPAENSYLYDYTVSAHYIRACALETPCDLGRVIYRLLPCLDLEELIHRLHREHAHFQQLHVSRTVHGKSCLWEGSSSKTRKSRSVHWGSMASYRMQGNSCRGDPRLHKLKAWGRDSSLSHFVVHDASAVSTSIGWTCARKTQWRIKASISSLNSASNPSCQEFAWLLKMTIQPTEANTVTCEKSQRCCGVQDCSRPLQSRRALHLLPKGLCKLVVEATVLGMLQDACNQPSHPQPAGLRCFLAKSHS